MLSLGEVDRALISHAKYVWQEANRLLREGIPYSKFKLFKRKWELELYTFLSDLLGELLIHGKDCGFVGEVDSKWVCICDVFDGSRNFYEGLKYYSYNVALAKDDDIIYALCIDLENFDIYRAERGRGATLNGENLMKISEEFLSSGVSKGIVLSSNTSIPGIPTMHFKCSSLELCALAKGVAEVLVGTSWNEDIAAAYLIALETGLQILDWDLKPIRLPVRYREKLRYVAGRKDKIEKYSNVISVMKKWLTLGTNIVLMTAILSLSTITSLLNVLFN